jgi:hypothetical protein
VSSQPNAQEGGMLSDFYVVMYPAGIPGQTSLYQASNHLLLSGRRPLQANIPQYLCAFFVMAEATTDLYHSTHPTISTLSPH